MADDRIIESYYPCESNDCKYYEKFIDVVHHIREEKATLIWKFKRSSCLYCKRFIKPDIFKAHNV